jgi:phasin
MRDPVTTAPATKFAPTPEVPQAMRDMAEKGTAHAKATYDKMSAATTEASNAMQSAHSTAVQGAVECNTKVVEYARINTNAAFDYAAKLLAVKSPSEFIEISAEHARKQFEVLTGQSKEFTALSQKVMLEAAKPLKDGAAKMFQGAAT